MMDSSPILCRHFRSPRNALLFERIAHCSLVEPRSYVHANKSAPLSGFQMCSNYPHGLSSQSSTIENNISWFIGLILNQKLFFHPLFRQSIKTLRFNIQPGRSNSRNIMLSSFSQVDQPMGLEGRRLLSYGCPIGRICKRHCMNLGFQSGGCEGLVLLQCHCSG